MAISSVVPFADPLWHSRASNVYYKESHKKLQAEAREYVDTHIAPFCEEWERQGSVPPEVVLTTSLGFRGDQV